MRDHLPNTRSIKYKALYSWMIGKINDGSFAYKESFEENKIILRDFVRFLCSRHIEPVVVITPFTDEYNRFVLEEMKEAVLELLNGVPEPIHYIDFNQSPCLDPSDFTDTDHLSGTGAQKVSAMLADLFGS